MLAFALLLQTTVSSPLIMSHKCVPGQLGACFSITMQTVTTTIPSVQYPGWNESRTTMILRVRNEGTGSYAVRPYRMAFPYSNNLPNMTGPNCIYPQAFYRSLGTYCDAVNTLGLPEDAGTPINGATVVGQPSWTAFVDTGLIEFFVTKPIFGCNPIIDPSVTDYYVTCGKQAIEFAFETAGAWDISTDLGFIDIGGCTITGPAGSGVARNECATMNVVPEPMTLVLVGTGLAGTAWLRRRRKDYGGIV